MTTTVQQTAYSVEAAIEALASVGINVPSDTTAENFVERLLTVLIALQGAAEAKKKEDAEKLRGGGLALSSFEIGGRVFNSVKEIALDTATGELTDDEADAAATRQLKAVGLLA